MFAAASSPRTACVSDHETPALGLKGPVKAIINVKIGPTIIIIDANFLEIIFPLF